jgi:hypothetical protein
MTHGGMAEWSKALDSKSSRPQKGLEGSNPSPTAMRYERIVSRKIRIDEYTQNIHSNQLFGPFMRTFRLPLDKYSFSFPFFIFEIDWRFVEEISLARPLLHPTIPLFYLFNPFPMSYVVASAIKDLLKKEGMMTAGDFPEAASSFLEAKIKKAAKRAKDNGRVTVRGYDL